MAIAGQDDWRPADRSGSVTGFGSEAIGREQGGFSWSAQAWRLDLARSN